MVSLQPVINPLSQAASFIILTINKGKEDHAKETLSGLSDCIKDVSFRAPNDNLHAIAGISVDGWDKLSLGEKPPHLHKFPELTGDKHHAPSTPGDILLHIRSATRGSAFELARLILSQFGDSVEIADKVDGFLYFDQRDLLGFCDGTANPVGEDAQTTVFIDSKDRFSGGSYVYVQKYTHDLTAWNKLSVEEQENVIGRTKLDNVEIPDGVKPTNSHVALNTITEPDGSERDIYRANMPFGDLETGEVGTYYIGYAADPSTIELMLRHMFIGNPPGNTDRILEFSQAKTGTAFYVPTVDFIGSL